MVRKIKTKKGFIQIPLLIAIIVSIIAATGIGYGAIEYNKTSKIIKEAEQLSKEEKYNEAIGKLELAQNKLLGKIILKQKISTKLDENKKLLTDKTKYDEGVNKLNEGDLQGSIDLLSELPENSFYYQKAQTKIEESKRKMLEEELSEEQIARKEAEAKAKQEEFEKKLKEQQLISKEAEERMMNADNDSDGLTYREESKKGTSDWNKDSDFDGIPDNLDLHPAGGGRNVAQTFSWSYGGYNWSFTAYLHEDWYEYYKAKPRASPLSLEYVTYNDPFIKTIAKKISEAAEKDNLSKNSLAVAFVQSLSYLDDVYTGYNEYPKYPVETFFEKNGDCEDMSYLTASIISAMNIGDVLVVLPGHIAVGIWFDCEMPGTYYKLDGRCYYYTETTGEGWFSGEIPDKYKYTTATLIKIPSGETISNVSPQYVKPCFSSKDFPGYYSDGENFYSDSQCNNLTYCVYYKEFYVNPKTIDFYWDSNCSQIVVKGCYKSKSYPGYFYKSGSAWYYDSQCTQLYQSMSCNYPSIWSYSCTSEYSYTSKKSTCDYYQSSEYFKDLAADCYQKLEQCRRDIDEYQQKKSEYDQCWSRIEY
jgi:hypothetical protein